MTPPDPSGDRSSEDESALDEVPDDPTPELPSVVARPSVELPPGYAYGVTRYADLILKDAFPHHFEDLCTVLSNYRITADELIKGGGNRGSHTARFDKSLENRGRWGKRRIRISRMIDDKPIHITPGHEIDMFATGSDDDPYPGIGVEMEWNNKDPFFDRDLLNFQALHREGALAVGVIVTRGPELQKVVKKTIYTSAKTPSNKFGESTTHWNKLIPRVNLGGGGECPLLLIGIEPDRVDDWDVIQMAYDAGTRLP